MTDGNFFTDEDLVELLEFIGGEKYGWIGGNGVHTYPNGDENNKRLFAGCAELEKRGKVRREIDEPGHVLFCGDKIAILTRTQKRVY